jgi:hypothetical protein
VTITLITIAFTGGVIFGQGFERETQRQVQELTP